jgi:hypothetical protein
MYGYNGCDCGATDCRRCYGSRADDEKVYDLWSEHVSEAASVLCDAGITDATVRSAIKLLRAVLATDPQTLVDGLDGGAALVADLTGAVVDLADESGPFDAAKQTTEDDIRERLEEARGEWAIDRAMARMEDYDYGC